MIRWGSKLLSGAFQGKTRKGARGKRRTLFLESLEDRRLLAADIEFFTPTSNDDETSGGNLPFLLVTGTLASDETVQVNVTGGDATPGNDFTNTASVTIPAGSYINVLFLTNLSITPDPTVELNETIELTLQNPTGDLSVGDASGNTATLSVHTYTIDDDDIATFTISGQTVNEDAGTLTFTVSLDNPIDIPVTVDVSYMNGSATGSSGGTNADYDNDSDAVMFSALDTADKMVTVTITDDDIIELAENFTATLSTATSLGTRLTDLTDTGTGTINESDIPSGSDRLTLSLDSTFRNVTLTLSDPTTGRLFNTDDPTNPATTIDFVDVGFLVVQGAGEDNRLTVDYSNGDPLSVLPGGLLFSGGGGSDSLAVIGDGTNTATYTPEVATTGNGTVAVDGSTITFAGLEPVDISGMLLATLSLPGADDVVTLTNGFDSATGLVPAIVVTGTSGGVTFETAHLFGNTTVVIDTASIIDGDDTITVASADNAHGNVNLTINTGTGTDVITLSGNVTTTGAQIYGGPMRVAADSTLTGDTISFSSTIDDDGVGGTTSNLVISDSGVPVFGANVGGVDPLSSLAVNLTAGGTLSLAANITTVADLTVTVADTAADTDDLMLSAPAVLTLNMGSVRFDIGDDVSLPTGTTISAPVGTITINVDAAASDVDNPDVGSMVTVEADLAAMRADLTGGDDDDTFNITPDDDTPISVDGMLPVAPAMPGDTLNINLDGVLNPQLGLRGVGAETLTSANRAAVSAVSIETFNVTSSGGGGGGGNTYRLVIDTTQIDLGAGIIGGDGSADSVEMSLAAASTSLQVVVNGVVIFADDLADINGIQVLGSDDDDTLTIDNANGLINRDIDYRGMGQQTTPMGDTLVIEGDPGSSIMRETYIVGLTEDAGIWVLDPNDSTGPGAGGGTGLAVDGFDGDEQVITFTGLEPVDTSTPAALFDIILTAGADNLTIEDGGLLSGVDSARVVDNAGTFETFRFTNKATVRLNGLDGADVLEVNHPTPANGLTSLQLYGHDITGTDATDDLAADVFNIRATAAQYETRIFGGGGNDTVNISSDAPTNAGNLDGILGAVLVFGEDHDAGSPMVQSVTAKALTVTVSIDMGDTLNISDQAKRNRQCLHADRYHVPTDGGGDERADQLRHHRDAEHRDRQRRGQHRCDRHG